MNALPLIDRELRLGARRPATYWMRSGLAGAACVLWFLILAGSRSTTPVHVKALLLFWTGAILAFGFCLLAGMFLTADCVSGEKREGTLGLLFLTDLKTHDVILGKLAATSLHAAYGLAGMLPLLALPMLLGGVALGEFWRITLVLTTTLFLSLAVGLAVSTVSREARQAMMATLAVLVGLAGILPLTWWVAGTFFPGVKAAVQVLLLACPPWGLELATDPLYLATSGARNYWVFLGVQAALGVLALAAAGARAPRIQTEFRETVTAGFHAGWQRLRLGSPAARRRRRRFIAVDPFFWLTSRDRVPLAVAWIIVGGLFGIWLAFLLGSFGAAGTKREVCFAVAAFMAYGAFVLGKTLVALEAARRTSEDRQNGTLELLLVTPLPVEEMIAGQRRAIHRVFLGPGLVVVLMNVVLLGLVADFNRSGGGHSGVAICCFLLAVGGLLLKGDMTALSHVGLWTGLRTRRLHRAFFEMLGRVMLVPWAGAAFFAVSLILGVGLPAGDMFLLLFVWVLISLLADAIAGARARDQLNREFRHAAVGDRRPREPADEAAGAEYYSLVRST